MACHRGRIEFFSPCSVKSVFYYRPAERLTTLLCRRKIACREAWTYLKSWRDKQTNKSRKQALIQVRSWWTLLSFVKIISFRVLRLAQGSDRDDILKNFFILLLVSSSHFHFLQLTFRISFSLTNRAYLMMIFSHSNIIENQNFPIDTHFHLQRFHNFFHHLFFANFPIIGISLLLLLFS